MRAQPVLELRDIVKTFPGVRALDGARFDLRGGEVHALIGENGAGKSTLMNILAGVLRPDSGSILLDGRPVAFRNPHHASQHGIAVVFQELSLVPNLCISENIFANRQPTSPLGLIDWPTLHAATRDLLALFNLPVSPTTLVRNLSVAHRQVVEILKAISHNPRVLILDEPTSSLTAQETRLLFQNIRRLRSQGVAFIYISHHLSEIFDIADRVTILRDGRYVDTLNIADATEDLIVRKMVGRELANIYSHRKKPIGDEYFHVQSASRRPAFHDLSFSLRQGEILGLAGLVGAGRTELARAIAGIEPLHSGSITLNNQPLRIRSPQQAIAHGIGYLTEDRKDQGLFLRMSIRDNLAAPSLRQFTRGGDWMNDAAVLAFAESNRECFNIVTPSVHQRVGNLSGGNQQKVLFSMWMGIKPKLLIVDEPTRGVDVGARAEIYHLLRSLAALHVGIIMISSDLPEILGLSDRVLVLRNGQIAAELQKSQLTEESIISAATGVQLN
jgi:ABC-type sugar transport system ATPase subunit